ncbi:MAG: Hsp20/alpha crystallin family protein [Parcubacteria group bacterium]|nr:Hsp20/alpha crystallin family protein [Parcubacteria group bacterium]
MPRAKKSPDASSRPAILEEGEPGQLTVDVHQKPEEFVIQSTVAGVTPEDLDINVTEDMVTIRGKRHRDEEFNQAGALYQECFWGSFSRTVILPGHVDPSRAAATLKNGVLTLRLPRVEKTKSKQIEVS